MLIFVSYTHTITEIKCPGENYNINYLPTTNEVKQKIFATKATTSSRANNYNNTKLGSGYIQLKLLLSSCKNGYPKYVCLCQSKNHMRININNKTENSSEIYGKSSIIREARELAKTKNNNKIGHIETIMWWIFRAIV